MTAGPPTNRTAAALRNALDEWVRVDVTWVHATFDLACCLGEARSECGGDDTAFGEWLEANECNDLDRNTRAALLKMAEHPGESFTALASTKRHSIRLIWEHEIRPRVEPKLKPKKEDLSQLCERPPPERGPPVKPDYLTITAEERDQAKAEAERKQQAAAAAFEADQAARRTQEAQDAIAEAASNYDALVAAWEICTEEEQLHFLRNFIGQERQDIG